MVRWRFVSAARASAAGARCDGERVMNAINAAVGPPCSWVYSYTEDAVFVAPGAPAVQGRAALLQMAKAMKPLSSVSIQPMRTEGSGGLATVYAHASWVSGRPPEAGSVAKVRGIIVWRKEADRQWRVAQELLNADPAAGR